MITKEKIVEILKNNSQKSIIGWAVEEDDFEHVAEEVVKNCSIPVVSDSLLSDIRDEMDADMEDSGMAQGEIESCLTHWENKYVITRKRVV